jgi:cell wall-associated NlpC family hydrolase
MVLGLASSLLADPDKSPQTSVQQPAPADQKAAQSETPPVPEGKELTPRELQIILQPIIKDAKASAEAAREMTGKDPAADKSSSSFISKVVQGTKKLVTRAMTYAGARYKWGGSSRSGIDCSGLTRILYLAEGVKLPHNAKQQFKLGKPVPRQGLLPGDLVFFNTRGPLTHVGMWIGNGQFIHAASRMRGVRVDSLSKAYYAKRFAGARRYKEFGRMTASAGAP